MKPLGFTVQEMGALLDARDRVADGNDPEARDALRGFATAAKQKIAALHEQLERAEKLSRALERETKRHKRAKQPTRR